MCVCVRARVWWLQRSAVAVAYCNAGKGSIKLNGCPIELIEPEILRLKVGASHTPPQPRGHGGAPRRAHCAEPPAAAH